MQDIMNNNNNFFFSSGTRVRVRMEPDSDWEGKVICAVNSGRDYWVLLCCSWHPIGELKMCQATDLTVISDPCKADAAGGLNVIDTSL